MKRILICDDEADIREVLEMLIEVEFDVEIIHASDGQEGIDKLQSDPKLDLIICDMNMPHKKGSDVFTVNKSLNNIPFVLLCGDSDDVEKFEEFKSSNTHNTQISKPWNEDELYNKLGLILKSS